MVQRLDLSVTRRDLLKLGGTALAAGALAVPRAAEAPTPRTRTR